MTTILIVDDDINILQLVSINLSEAGYKVLQAKDGTEALAVLNKETCNLAVVDVMMPYMDGPATIRALQKLNPRVKIIASSGLTDNARVAEAANSAVSKFLSKPYTAEKLLEAIAEVLSED